MPVSLEDQPARLPGDRRAKLDARAAELIAQEMILRDLRRASIARRSMARALGVKQETVSRLEKRSCCCPRCAASRRRGRSARPVGDLPGPPACA